MRAITLTQPWCGLMVAGIKLIENRVRKIIPDSLLGSPIAFHASREIDKSAYDRIYEIAPELRPERATTREQSRWHQLARVTGAVIGVGVPVRLVYGMPGDLLLSGYQIAPGLAEQSRWFFGPVGHLFRDMRTIAEPVACRGMLGCWTLPDDIERAVVRQLAEAA